MFRSTMNKGFQMTFPNNWTVSVQWGAGNYCERQDIMGEHDESMHHHAWESADAEVACRYGIGSWEEVQGHLSPEEVTAFILDVSQRVGPWSGPEE